MRGGVNVLREKVKVNIHHYCGLQVSCKATTFTLPITFLRLASNHMHTQTHFTHILLAIPQQLTLKMNSNAPDIPIIENHFTHLQYSSHTVSGQNAYRHLCIYNGSHACKETHLMFVFAFYWGIFYSLKTRITITEVSLTAI